MPALTERNESMRTLIVAAAALAALSLSTGALAQSTSTTATTTTTSSTSGAKFTVAAPTETIAADPAGKAVLDKDMPGLTTHEAYDSFKSMSLKAVQPMSNGAISDAALAKVAADLAMVK